MTNYKITIKPILMGLNHTLYRELEVLIDENETINTLYERGQQMFKTRYESSFLHTLENFLLTFNNYNIVHKTDQKIINTFKRKEILLNLIPIAVNETSKYDLIDIFIEKYFQVYLKDIIQEEDHYDMYESYTFEECECDKKILELQSYLGNKEFPCIVLHRWIEIINSESLDLSKKQFDKMLYYCQEEGEDKQLEMDFHCTKKYPECFYTDENGEICVVYLDTQNIYFNFDGSDAKYSPDSRYYIRDFKIERQLYVTILKKFMNYETRKIRIEYQGDIPVNFVIRCQPDSHYGDMLDYKVCETNTADNFSYLIKPDCFDWLIKQLLFDKVCKISGHCHYHKLFEK